ncbi:MAG: acetylxylan esterase [Acidobacteria bacterium]|nr:acetylxylan esterase [Acidobacteriota bacterium]
MSTTAPAPAERRRLLYKLLGDLPPRNRKISARTVSREDRGSYVLERLELDLNGLEPAPAWFARPKQAAGRIPAILYNHAHGGDYKLGKDELIRGRIQLQKPPFAEALTSQGYCALCMDTWVFGERARRTELDVFKEMLWKGQVLWGMMVYDSLRGLDYLASRPGVDASRIGTLGLSMGSTMSWWVAALDPLVKACFDICCLTDFQALLDTDNLKGHGVYYYVPALLKHFTTAQINALIAPRAHLSLAGDRDALTPPAGLERIDRELKEVYAAAGHPERWKLLRYDAGHQETPEGRREILNFLREHL